MKKTVSLVLAFIMLTLGTFSITANAQTAKNVKGKINYSFAAEVLNRINGEREKRGVSKLVMTKALTLGSEKRAAEFALEQSHTRPNGKQFYTAFKWDIIVGENLAYGQSTPRQVVKEWMASSAHKDNILDKRFKTVGITCFIVNGTYYWAQDFSGGEGDSYTKSGTSEETFSVSYSADRETVKLPKVKATSIVTLTGGKKYFKAKWKKVSSADGYQLRFSRSSKFSKSITKTLKIKGKENISKTVKKRKSKKTYYVKVRAYKRIDGRVCYSKWSKVKKIKVK